MLKTWMTGLLRQRGVQMAMAYSGVALAIALVALIGVFSISSSRTMTTRALAQVPVDWQVELRQPAADASVQAAIRAVPGVTAVQRTGYADVASFEASTAGTTQATGAGLAIGLSPGYFAAFPGQIRMLLGSPDDVILAQQTAANLHAGVGDTVRIIRPGGKVATVKVGGIAELPTAASLLQTVGAPVGAAPAPPPDNVVLMPLDQWQTIVGSAASGSPTARTEFHVAFDHSALAASPDTAYAEAGGRVRNFEAHTAGEALVADNLGARLDAVRGDSIYAQILFLFLGLPAVVLSLLLTISLLASDADRRRRNESLLRLRGFDRRTILATISLEETLGAIGAALVGSAIAVIVAGLSFGVDAFSTHAALWIGASALGGVVASFLCGILPALTRFREQTVNAGRVQLAVATVPLWQRLWLDVALIAVAFVIFWRSAATNYQVVLAPEGVVASAVDYTAFLAPLFFWVGTVLLSLRVAAAIIGNGQRVIEAGIRVAAPATQLAPMAAASLSRQNRRIAAGAALATLAFSFAFATAIFNRTYDGQAKVDAILTNGADVSIVGSTGHPVTPLVDAMRQRVGVADAVPMQHRFAYVGNDLQDLYGIDPDTIGRATTLANSYFASGDAAATMSRLKAVEDGVLVSQETVNDFQLAVGDSLNLRLKDSATGTYKQVPFHFVGIVEEFPTAPKDSFLVANARYVAKATGDPGAETLLVRASGDPASLASDIRRDLGTPSPFLVTDVGDATRTVASSLTAVDLGRLTRIELLFAGLLLAASAGLVLALGFRERRRTADILAALGARPQEIASFLWSEAILVLGFGALFGSVIGVSVAAMLVKLLSGIFDPPPDALSYPLWQLLAFAAVGITASLLAVRTCLPGEESTTTAIPS